jgi:hypothetical protein
MTKAEYEMAYKEARTVLLLRGKAVEKPTSGRSGRRRCRVDGKPLSDGDIFSEAWDDHVAEELLQARFNHRELRRAG